MEVVGKLPTAWVIYPNLPLSLSCKVKKIFQTEQVDGMAVVGKLPTNWVIWPKFGNLCETDPKKRDERRLWKVRKTMERYCVRC